MQQLLGGGLSADSIRQLAHELRTPLNAIRGFAELIEGRFFGPVSQSYGELAHKIVTDASRLMTVIDDLDSAARLQTGAWAEDVHAQQTCDMAKVLTAVTEDLRKMGHSQSIELRVAIGRDVPLAHIPEAAATRLVGRLLAAVASTAEEREGLSANLEKTPTGIAFRLSRPKRLSGVSREQILATASVSDNGLGDALPLGLGFTFRLIDAMAHASGAYLEMGSEMFSLVLPAHGQGAGESKESG